MDYGVKSSSAWDARSKNFFEWNNYSAAFHHTFRHHYIYTMIRERKFPSYVSGKSRIDGGEGRHAWVVDGWMTKIRHQYRVDDPPKRTAYSESYEFIHCNFGWSGGCDGYYYEGVFDLRKGAPIPDTIVDRNTDTTKYRIYDRKMRVVTYTEIH